MRPESAASAAEMLSEFARVVSPHYQNLRQQFAENAGAQLTLNSLQHEANNAKANYALLTNFTKLLPATPEGDEESMYVDDATTFRLALAHTIWRPSDSTAGPYDTDRGPFYFLGSTGFEPASHEGPDRRMLIVSASPQPKLFTADTWQPEIDAFVWQRGMTEAGAYADGESDVITQSFDAERSQVYINYTSPHAITFARSQGLFAPIYPRRRADVPPIDKLRQERKGFSFKRSGGLIASPLVALSPHEITDQVLSEFDGLDHVNRLAIAFDKSADFAELIARYTITQPEPVEEAINNTQ